MELKIGPKITELRKNKGLTQEQLAAALGVSAPAVSKWETDNSYPDITLLCPLARALNTDVDSLLSFEEDLSQESLSRYMVEIINIAREGKVKEAEEKLQMLLHHYPSNIPLKFSATATLSFFEMSMPDCTPEDKARWLEQKKELVQAVHDDGNPAYYLPSISMLVSLALAEDDLEKAENLLKETLTNTADFTTLWVQLYLKKGERDQALQTVQQQLYKLVGEVQTCLMSMLGEEMALDTDRTLEVCHVLQKLYQLFRVGGGIGVGLFAEVYLREGKTDEALDYLEQLADQLTKQMEPPNPLLFAPAITPDSGQLSWSKELCAVILHSLEKDDCFKPLREQERFKKLVGKIASSVANDAEGLQHCI